MPTLAERIWEHVRLYPGCSEREIASSVIGPQAIQQQVNPTVRRLVESGVLVRNASRRPYTYTTGTLDLAPRFELRPQTSHEFPTEDQIKAILRDHLIGLGFQVKVAMGHERGIDIDASKDSERWLIEVKGPGSRPEMRVNYFISMLGELLQRMDDPSARYSIALPDIPQFRRLWERLPQLAKDRTTISAIFVSMTGQIDLLD